MSAPPRALCLRPRRNRIDYTLYPPNWFSEIRPAVLARAGNRCEGSPAYPDCRAANGEPHPVTGSRVVLTIAHLHGSSKLTQNLDELRAWCQRCHLMYDLPHHIRKAAQTRRMRRRDAGQLELPMKSYEPLRATLVMAQQETFKALLHDFYELVYATQWGSTPAHEHAEKIPWSLMDKFTDRLLDEMVEAYCAGAKDERARLVDLDVRDLMQKEEQWRAWIVAMAIAAACKESTPVTGTAAASGSATAAGV